MLDQGNPQGINMHYVPQFILRKFADSSQKKKRKLWVYDKAERKWEHDFVKNLGSLPGFYEIEDARDNPDGLENFFSKWETKAAPIINSVDMTKKLPDYKERNYGELICFIAFLFARSPAIRNRIGTPWGKIARDFNKIEKKFMEDRNSSDTSTIDESTIPDNMFSFKEVKGEIEFKMKQNQHLKNIISIFAGAAMKMLELSWSVSIMKGTSLGFICNDNPVIKLPFEAYFCPISSTTSLFGVKDEISCSFFVDKKRVGWNNRLSVENAERYVFTGSKDFPILVGMNLIRDLMEENSITIPIGEYFE